MQDKERKRPSSLILGSKEKLPSPVLSWPPRARQLRLWRPRPPRTFSPSHLHLPLPRSNLTLRGWTSLPSWPVMASWPVTSARSVLKTTCISIVVQKTTSWTLVPRSRLRSLPKAMVLQQPLILQQLSLRNPRKNKEQPPELRTDWGPCWTSLCSNKSDLTQCICSFWSSFTLCFPYFSFDSWSGSP